MKKEKMVKDLKSSPIYNMSQSSLENFHTSFLCWLGNTYPVAFKKLFNKFNKKRFDEDKKHSCETQVKHTLLKNEDDEKNKSIRTDLEFQFNNNELIIIENKIKSYPDYDQLEKYYDIINKENKRTIFILLSLVEGNKIKLPKTWNYMSYSDLAKNMRRIFKHEKGYYKYLIQDYINVITKISNIFSEADNIEKEKYNFYKYDQKGNENDEINKYDLRDIFIKFKTSELAKYINKNIKEKDNWKIKEGFSRRQGIVDIIRKLDEKSRFHIQIQGKQYSYGFVYLENESNEKIWEKRREIANKLKEKEYWFFNTKNTKRTTYENFRSDEPDFIYRCSKEKIDEKTYKEIVNIINKDIKNFEDHLDEIKKLIAKFVK